MKKITKQEAIEALSYVLEDIDMLEEGSWEPDEDSCDCTRDNLLKIKAFIEEQP